MLPPTRLHPISPFFALIRHGRQILLSLAFVLFAGRDADVTQLYFPLALGLLSVLGVVGYLRFTYRIDGGALIVEEGLLTRKQRVVPLGRVQQFDVEAGVLHQMLGVVVVKLDTASGGSGADVTLTVVSRADAERLRALVAQGRKSAPPADAGNEAADAEPVPEDEHEGKHEDEVEHTGGEVLLQLPPAELAIAGVTSMQLVFVLTLLGPLMELTDDLPGAFVEGFGSVAEGRSTVAVAIVTTLFAAVLWIGGTAVGSMLTYGGYTLTRRGSNLHVACGVFSRRETTVAIDRVQALRLRQNLARRLVGRSSMHIQSGAVTGTRTRLVVPIIRAADVPELLAAVLPGVDVPQGAFEKAPAAARRRAIVRRAVPTGIAAAALVAIVRSPLSAVAAVLAVIAAGWVGELHYRALGLATSASAVVGRAGGFIRSTVVVPAHRVQAVAVRTTPFQRRSGLATLELPVAGSGTTPTVPDQRHTRLAAVATDVVRVAALDERRERRAMQRARHADAPVPAGPSQDGPTGTDAAHDATG